MQVLVDTSVWIDYFRGGVTGDTLDNLIDENILVVNDLILAELIPVLKLKKQRRLITLLSSVAMLDVRIDWQQIIDFQHRCLKQGINGVGIPDLIIAQNALQHRCSVYSLGRHFALMRQPLKLLLFPGKEVHKDR